MFCYAMTVWSARFQRAKTVFKSGGTVSRPSVVMTRAVTPIVRHRAAGMLAFAARDASAFYRAAIAAGFRGRGLADDLVDRMPIFLTRSSRVLTAEASRLFEQGKEQDMNHDRGDVIASTESSKLDGLLRMPAVVRQTGLARSTIYRLMASNEFPRPLRLARRAVGWRRADIDRWTQSLPTAAH